MTLITAEQHAEQERQDAVKQAVATLMQREWNSGANGREVTVVRLELERLRDVAERERRRVARLVDIIGHAAAEAQDV